MSLYCAIIYPDSFLFYGLNHINEEKSHQTISGKELWGHSKCMSANLFSLTDAEVSSKRVLFFSGFDCVVQLKAEKMRCCLTTVLNIYQNLMSIRSQSKD